MHQGREEFQNFFRPLSWFWWYMHLMNWQTLSYRTFGYSIKEAPAGKREFHSLYGFYPEYPAADTG